MIYNIYSFSYYFDANYNRPFHRRFLRWNGQKLHLEFELTFKGGIIADDQDGVGAAESRGEVDLALDGDIGGEHHVVVLIQKLDGGTERVVTRSQRVTVYI